METDIAKQIEVKFKMLDLAVKDGNRIFERKRENELMKHQKIFENMLDEIKQLKYKYQEDLLLKDTEESEIEEKLVLIQNKMNIYDDVMEEIENEISRLKTKEEEKKEERRLEHRLLEERKIQEIKKQMKTKEEENSICNTVKVRLPKLIITKFEGTHLDWFRFWNQFQTEINKSDISPVSKFSYLKEFLPHRVRLLIDGLPFTNEGYNRAKAILENKFGKTSEVANAHMQNIIHLPRIHDFSLAKVHDFYEKLMNSVQSLETMGKLSEINGYVRITIDKLPYIRADLVRNDENWQDWKFPDLVQALRQWTERNPMSWSNYERKKVSEKSYHTKSGKYSCVYCRKHQPQI